MASAGTRAAFCGIRGYVVKLNAGIRRHPRACGLPFGLFAATWLSRSRGFQVDLEGPLSKALAGRSEGFQVDLEGPLCKALAGGSRDSKLIWKAL